VRTRVKICGITRLQDARAATDAGADAIGMIFFPSSPRAVDLAVAATIARAVPALVDTVGVFVDPERADVEAVLERVELSLLQFHGNETAEQCKCFGLPYIKAARMHAATDPNAIAAAHPDARALLLDAYQQDRVGGTGTSFDWVRAAVCKSSPVILAGGLAAANVADALRQSGAYAVDVSSGVESRPGIKSAERIHEFVAAVASFNSKENNAGGLV